MLWGHLSTESTSAIDPSPQREPLTGTAGAYELLAGEYRVELPEFEGPLDLLLHLVKRHELDIIDIPISFITARYLEYLEVMRSLNLDLAGEYLLMAATLAQIKSRELLPHPETLADAEDESEIDPRQELVRRLLEYQRYKEAASALAERPTLGRDVFERGSPIETPDKKDTPLAQVSTYALVRALMGILKRSKAQASYDVVVDRISITDRINDLVDRLDRQSTLSLDECFDREDVTRQDIVVTLLAILELARLRMVQLMQQQSCDRIYITRRESLQRVENADESFA